MKVLFLFFMVPGISLSQAKQDTSHLEKFANVFFAWRALQQPCGPDDIPRVQRPAGWVPRYSKEDLAYYDQFTQDARVKLKSYEKHLPTRKDSITYLLLRSAIERVNWELNVLRQPFRNPDFYVHQTLGAIYELLLISSPMTNERTEDIILRLRSVPATVGNARENLTDPIRAFADIAIENLEGVRIKMNHCISALEKVCHPGYHASLRSAADSAVLSLEEYRQWLLARRGTMKSRFNIDRDMYTYFLKYIALIPVTPEDLVLMGRMEWNRAVALETMEQHRNRKLSEDPLFETIEQQVEQERKDEAEVRKFLEQNRLLTIPKETGHYLHRPVPDHLKPFTFMGVPDDLTGENRLGEDGYHYIPPPSRELPFFYLATARDPRPIIVHEGIPGHYFQLVRAWQNPDPIRRRYFDSGANEGIGFYVEELLLQQGLFDNKPRTREILYRFMRLRALRVEADVMLALNRFSVEEAADFLVTKVPMDRVTAGEEARFFAYNPGQAISYQAGKSQILQFLSDAKAIQGDNFDLKAFHDYLMVNGNVPIALLRWEYTGLNDEIAKLWN